MYKRKRTRKCQSRDCHADRPSGEGPRKAPPFSEGGWTILIQSRHIKIKSCKGLTFWDFEVLRDPSL